MFLIHFALIPMAEVLLLFGLARIGLQAMGYASLIQLIATVVIKPLLTVGTGLPAIIVVILLEQILWFLGLHGFNIVWGSYRPSGYRYSYKMLLSLLKPKFCRYFDRT